MAATSPHIRELTLRLQREVVDTHEMSSRQWSELETSNAFEVNDNDSTQR
jgi:hypothetical protein